MQKELATLKGSLNPKTITEAISLAKDIAKTDIIPDHLKDKPNDILVTIMYGSEVGLSAIQSITSIAVIRGKPSLYGDSLLGICQAHKDFIRITETFDAQTNTATCVTERQGHEPHITTFSQAMAERAGLWQVSAMITRKNFNTGQSYVTENDSPWYRYPERMLQMRARGFGLRDKFADALCGVISREEAEDMRDITANSEVISTEPLNRDVKPEPVLEASQSDAPYMSAEIFAKNFPQYERLIKRGAKKVDDIIFTVQEKFTFTPDQLKQINEVQLND